MAEKLRQEIALRSEQVIEIDEQGNVHIPDEATALKETIRKDREVMQRVQSCGSCTDCSEMLRARLVAKDG